MVQHPIKILLLFSMYKAYLLEQSKTIFYFIDNGLK